MDAEKSVPVDSETTDISAPENDNSTKNENESQEKDANGNAADQDQDSPKTEETDGEKQDTETAMDDNKQGETKEGTETEEEQASQVPPDLPQLSSEIDQYITCVSSSSSPEPVPICVEQFALLFDSKMDEYESPEEPVKWRNLSREDADSFLEAVDRIARLYNKLSEFSSDYQFHYSINRIGSILQRSMSYVEEEFKSLMEDYRVPETEFHENSSSPETDHDQQQENPENEAPAEEDASDDDKIVDELGYPGEQLSSLRKLAKVMIAGGYETECCQVYFITRRNILEVTPHKFGFQKLSIDDVLKMNWESLEREIPIWIKTFGLYANSELPREKKIADSIFPDHPRISETLFCSLSRGVIVQLINFSEAVAMTKRAAEKLFKFLDVYETLRDVLPVMERMFPEAKADDIKSEATLNRSRLGEAMLSIFSELENSIKADSARTPVPGGAVHPLTRYTVNYLRYVCEYRDTLEHVFREHWKIERADSGTGSDYDYTAQQNQGQSNINQKLMQSPFQAQLIKVMDLLDANLEAKSTLYKDPSLSSIFMMNNGRYILQKVRGSPEISSMMGDTWCRKRSSDLRQYHKNYQRETWGKLIAILTNHEGLYVNGKVVKPVLKERFKSFNATFDEIHRTQSSWVVSDEQLQSELRVSISNMVIPAYRAFLSRYGGAMTPGRQTDKYVKYQADDIETYVDELFDGNTNPPPGARRR